MRQYLLLKNGLSYNLVLGIWGWYSEYPLFDMVFSACPLVVKQYLLFKNGLACNLVLRIWGWYNEYLLFEIVFSACPLVVRQYLLFKNCLSYNLVLRIWGWYSEYPLFEIVFSACPCAGQMVQKKQENKRMQLWPEACMPRFWFEVLVQTVPLQNKELTICFNASDGA